MLTALNESFTSLTQSITKCNRGRFVRPGAKTTDFVARFCIRGRVVQTLVDTMLAKGIGVPNAKDGQTSIPAQHHRLVTFAVEFLINVFHYGSRDGHVLVQHVIRETEIMTSLLMPYGLLCVECLPTASTAHMINESKRRQVAVVLSGLSRTLAG